MQKCFENLDDALAIAGGANRVYVLTELATGRKLYAVDSSPYRAYGAAGIMLGWKCALYDPRYGRPAVDRQALLDVIRSLTAEEKRRLREALN